MFETYGNSFLNSATEAPLLKQPRSDQQGATGQLSHAAKEFEAMLLTQWLQEAQGGFAAVPGSDDEQDPGGEQIKGFAVQSLAKALTDAGGLGIAELVSKALNDGKQMPTEPHMQSGDQLK